MKKVILSIVLLSFGLLVPAQSFDWGVKVNVGTPNLKIDDIQNLENNPDTENVFELLENTDAVLTYQLGVYARLKLAGIYIQPEVMFSNSKTEIKFENVMDENQELIGEVKLNKIDVPVLIGKRFTKNIQSKCRPRI